MTTDPTPDSAPEQDGRATRWSGHRERRRQSIVDVAIEVIGTMGPQTRLHDIAQAAGVTRQVVYRQFTDREDLDEAITKRITGMILGHLVAHLDMSAGISASLRKALTSYLDFIEENPALYAFVRAHETGRTTHAVSGVKDAIADIGLQIVDEMVESGAVDPAVPVNKVLALGLVGMIDAAVTQWLADDPPAPREQLIEGLSRMLDASVRAILGSLP
ncbi:MAG: TetR/AcrR family transcriptional regulator [Aeromicrobium sp.]|uniref:TetR/AcrR family transcriptional regulator n=1 Tax=Aeromicrobium sp. TaxID=1871063 RepID=UPI003C467B08